jgi:signal transduction histidine kinase
MVEAMATAVEINIESAVRNIDGLLSTEAEINLYRVVQEALTNLVRHSSAHSAEVSVRRVADTIEVVIVDDGRGFDSRHSARGEPGGGFGMRGMAERVRILNASGSSYRSIRSPPQRTAKRSSNDGRHHHRDRRRPSALPPGIDRCPGGRSIAPDRGRGLRW